MADETIKIDSGKTYEICRNPASDSCLQKSSTFHSTRTEEEEGVPQTYSSLLSMTHSHLAQEKLVSACCACCEQCNGLKSSKRSTAINHKKSYNQQQQLEETLQVYLIRTQVEEATIDDKQMSLMQHLTLISNAFEAVIQYMQSLQVSYLAAKRIFDMSHALLACYPPSNTDCIDDFILYYRQIEIEREKRTSNLRELIECYSKNVVFPKDMCTLLDDYRNRKKDFYLASANFKNLLENSRLTVSQMEKLQRQHDTILKNFQQSRRLLDVEFPKIINTYLSYIEMLKLFINRRLEALQQIFHNVGELYGNVDYKMHTVNLFKFIAVNLYQVVPPNIEKPVFQEQESIKETCQKCKVNRAEKK